MRKINGKEFKITPDLGILQWFHIGDHEQVENTIRDLKLLNIKKIRTGISWADWYTNEGLDWYDWLIPTLAREFELLPCFLYTPPSVGEKPRTSSPPKRLQDYADVMDVIITKYGDYFDYIELWNEPNNKSEWDFTLDPGWNKFSEMIKMAANWARHLGKKIVLGGMSPIDANWLSLMFEKGVMENIDVVGIHGFPDVFDVQWEGWEENISRVQQVLDRYESKAKIWITEAGYSTTHFDELKQIEQFVKILEAPVERIYWYTLTDLDQERDTVDGFHLDDREYHFGLKKAYGRPKLLYRLLMKNGISDIAGTYNKLSTNSKLKSNEPYVLITGGSGFVGTNIASKYLEQGEKVLIYDNLSREGVEKNYEWLKENYGNQVQLKVADIRDQFEVKKAVMGAKAVFHLAAQVAVTTSLANPVEDYEINIKGTMNVLETLRSMESPPPLIFTSTNKVYGDLTDIELQNVNSHYTPVDRNIRLKGINEDRALSFYSPYGCSKGSADQYVHDFSRIYDIPAVVFRMSCIYGPHQFGTEDQGWVAHFAINAMNREPISIYGDGKQVRDILFVDDLVRAFQLAEKNIEKISGEIFNIGGGTTNAVSLLEVIKILSNINYFNPELKFDSWRAGDQKYYVTDISKYNQMTGWEPRINYKKGIARLYHWLMKQSGLVKEEFVTAKLY